MHLTRMSSTAPRTAPLRLARRPVRSIAALALLAVVALTAFLAACGESQLTPDDFDPDRFVRVAGTTPDSLRMQGNVPTPIEASTMTFDASFLPARELSSVRIEIVSGNMAATIEIVTSGNRMYVRGRGVDQASEWVVTTIQEGDPIPFGELADIETFTDLGLSGATELSARAIVPCGQQRQCFVVRSADDLATEMLVDTQTYYPVRLQQTEPQSGQTLVITMGWNVDVEVTVPSGAREVTVEQLSLALLGLMGPLLFG